MNTTRTHLVPGQFRTVTTRQQALVKTARMLEDAGLRVIPQQWYENSQPDVVDNEGSHKGVVVQLSTSQEMWMSNLIARGLQALGQPITPANVENVMNTVLDPMLTGASSEEVPPAPSLVTTMRRTSEESAKHNTRQASDDTGDVPPSPGLLSAFRRS